jgi:ubiquitin-protein ligase
VHVYEGGLICMPLLEPQYWKSKTLMSDILQRVLGILHQEINPYSPANAELFRIYREEPLKYEEIIREQTKKYAKQAPRYFQEACIHINIINSE